MKRLWFTVVLAGLAVAGWADKLQFTDGTQREGRVTGFANLTFEVVDRAGATSRHAMATVKRIDFDAPAATLVTRTQGTIQGTLQRFENAAFTVKPDKGSDQQVAAMLIKELTIAGSDGREVDQVTDGDLTKHLAAGKVTIVDFYADWCGPCRMIGPYLADLAKKDDAVVLRKVNVDRNHALAQKYQVRAIPQIMVFDKTGKEVANIVGASREKVQQAVEKAKNGG